MMESILTSIIGGQRPILTDQETEFGELMGKVLSPSRPLQSEEFLRGRAEHIDGIRRALYQPGRHVLIHGLRGVGKSSLAQTVAFLQSKGNNPIIVGCDSESTFASIVKDIFDEAENKNPKVEQKTREFGGGFAKFGFKANRKISVKEGSIQKSGSINDAARLLQFLSENYADKVVVVIDEFDQITDKNEQKLFTNLVKQVSDKHISVTFIFCGIGSSPEDIMNAHNSADRYFHTVSLAQLPWEARFEIVEGAAKVLGIVSNKDTVIRISRISDGFPHYIHFISEKLFWQIFQNRSDGTMHPDLFESAMNDASEAMDIKLKGPYEKATRKYRNDYETVLWAAAYGHELVRRSSDIYESYNKIMDSYDGERLDRTSFNRKMHKLKQDNHANMLTGNRQGWYEFSEKMIRGYVRLRAAQHGIDLDGDHPAATRRITV